MFSRPSLAFRPLPLLGNPHLQTVLGNLCHFARERLPAQQHRVPLPDGDAIILHETTTAPRHSDTPCALLLHGLGGSHRSAYLVRLAHRLTEHGLRVFRMDLRGAGAGMTHARRFYTAGCSHDVRTSLEWLHERFPHAPLVLAGFSLGGNIALKLAGEAGAAPVPGLAGVASLAAPIDLAESARLIANLPIYDRFYVKLLISQVHAHARHFGETPFTFPRRLTLWEFDDLFTAPRNGFAGATDYHRQSSALPWIEHIRIPTFMLTSRDDPFVAWRPYESLPPASHIERHMVDSGGHLGFLGADGRGGIRWAESQIVAWILRQTSCSEPRVV